MLAFQGITLIEINSAVDECLHLCRHVCKISRASQDNHIAFCKLFICDDRKILKLLVIFVGSFQFVGEDVQISILDPVKPCLYSALLQN